MNSNDKKVLACVDQSAYADHVTDAAAWVAVHMKARLELLHVIDRDPAATHGDDRSGAIGFDAQEALLGKLTDDDAAIARIAREQGRQFLSRLCVRAQTAGVLEPDMRQRRGSLVDVLTEQQGDVRMVVMGRRGESSATTIRDLGRNVERMVRAIERPVLTVTEKFTPPERVLIAFDGGAASRNAVAMVASSPLFKGIPCHLMMVFNDNNRGAARQLETALSTLTAAGIETNSYQVMGDPETAIAIAIKKNQIGMLIMGAYTHSPLRNFIFGSRTTELLRASSVPTLLLR